MLNKVSSQDFSGGLSHSRMGREIKKIPSSLLSYSERKDLFESLKSRGDSGGLSKNEARGMLRNIADNRNDDFSRGETRRLTKYVEKATGYRDLNWHGSSAKRDSEKFSEQDK